MDYVKAGTPLEQAAEDLGVSLEQVEAAADYIANHRDAVEAEYEKILKRARRGNPAWVEALLARDAAELKRRIEKRTTISLAARSNA